MSTTTKRPAGRSHRGAHGFNTLLSASALAMTVGGWAVFSAGAPAAGQATTPALPALAGLELAPIPTVAALPGQASAPATLPGEALRPVSPPRPVAPRPPVATTRSSR